MNANNPKEVINNKRPSVYGASLTEVAVAGPFGQTAGALQHACRLDLIVGQVTVAAAISAKHQHSNVPGLWTDAKTVSITASTPKSATVNPATDQLTIAAHGYVENQLVVVGGTVLPEGSQPSTFYWVKVIDANTIQLKTANDGQVLDVTSAGTSVTVTAARVFSITYLPTVAGDQAHMPLRSSGRIVLTTGAGDSVELLAVKMNQED